MDEVIRVRPTTEASKRAIAWAKRFGVSVANRRVRVVYRPWYGFLFKGKKQGKNTTVDIIDLPPSVIGDKLVSRSGGGFRTEAVHKVSIPRDLLYGNTGGATEAIPQDDPDVPFGVEAVLDAESTTVTDWTEYTLGDAPPDERESLTTNDACVQGASAESARVVCRLVTDTVGIRLASSIENSLTVPPDTVNDEAKFWLEVETVSTKAVVTRTYIDEQWVRDNCNGYRFISTAVGRGITPLPIASAYRSGDRLVVAIGIRKQRGPFQESVYSDSYGYSSGNNRDCGSSAMVLIDGTLGDGEYTVNRYHFWDLATETDSRLIPSLWHDKVAPFDDQTWASYQGYASNSVAPVVAITADGDVVGAATVMCTRTGVVGTSGDLPWMFVANPVPTQALVTFDWPTDPDNPGGGVFTRTVREAVAHLSGGVMYYYAYSNSQTPGSPWASYIPWAFDYPRLVDVWENSPGGAFDAAYSRSLLEAEQELYVGAMMLASPDDDASWFLGVSYHRFKMANIAETTERAIPAPGLVCAFDIPNYRGYCVTYPTLYRQYDMNSWEQLDWDNSGIKLDIYPFFTTFTRGIGLAGMGVESTATAVARNGAMLRQSAWMFHGYQMDVFDSENRAVSEFRDPAVSAVTVPEDSDIPGAEVNSTVIVNAQLEVRDEEGAVTTPAGLLWTPGTNMYLSNDKGASWVRLYKGNLAQVAFVGNALWMTSAGHAAEIPGGGNG